MAQLGDRAHGLQGLDCVLQEPQGSNPAPLLTSFCLLPQFQFYVGRKHALSRAYTSALPITSRGGKALNFHSVTRREVFRQDIREETLRDRDMQYLGVSCWSQFLVSTAYAWNFNASALVQRQVVVKACSQLQCTSEPRVLL